MVSRSRTGCLTCRKRKLKCDEARPRCGQCIKATRDCIPSEGLVFRNQQNPSMNSSATPSNGSGNLASFYSYKNTFTKDTVWVDIPPTVSFVEVVDPYAEDPHESDPHMHISPNTTASYQNIASHSLEALSTAATSNPPSYMPPNTYSEQEPSYSAYHPAQADYMPSRHGLPISSTVSPATNSINNNISFLLNPSNTLLSVIDPNLESSVPQDSEQASAQESGDSSRMGRAGSKADRVESDHQVAYLLRNFADAPGQS